jgi:branched-subunit amino acid transport protein
MNDLMRMNELNILLTIAGLTIITLVTRSTFLFLGKHIVLPAWLQQGLRYAPACALIAIIMPDVFITPYPLNILTEQPKLIATVGAVALFLYRRNMIATLLFGMILFEIINLKLIF